MQPMFFRPTYPVTERSYLFSAVMAQSDFRGVRQNQLTLLLKTLSRRYSTNNKVPSSKSSHNCLIRLKHSALVSIVLHLGATAELRLDVWFPLPVDSFKKRQSCSKNLMKALLLGMFTLSFGRTWSKFRNTDISPLSTWSWFVLDDWISSIGRSLIILDSSCAITSTGSTKWIILKQSVPTNIWFANWKS